MMKIFNVLRNHNESKNEAFIFVEDHFSISAFLFQFLWLLYKRIWTPAVILIIIECILMLLDQNKILDQTIIFQLKLVTSVFIGICANDWYLTQLKKNNYQVIDVIVARNLEEAQLKFYRKNMPILEEAYV
ncbi:MAG: DUF2628 domain-containing protein [Rickettsiales bacterium]